MPVVTVWDGFYKSFTDAKSYQGFRLASTGRAVLHGFLVAPIITVFIGLPMTFEVNQFVSEITRRAEQDLPNFEIRQGKLLVDSEMPIILRDETQALIIDTTGCTTLEDLGTSNGILVTESTIYYKKSAYETDVYSFAQVQSLSKAQLLSYIPYFKWVVPIIATFMFAFYSAGNFLIALLCAWIYSISGKGKDKALTFGETYKLMLFSMTLPRLLIGLFAAFSLTIPFYFVITVASTIYFAHRGVVEFELIPPIPTSPAI